MRPMRSTMTFWWNARIHPIDWSNKISNGEVFSLTKIPDEHFTSMRYLYGWFHVEITCCTSYVGIAQNSPTSESEIFSSILAHSNNTSGITHKIDHTTKWLQRQFDRLPILISPTFLNSRLIYEVGKALNWKVRLIGLSNEATSDVLPMLASSNQSKSIPRHWLSDETYFKQKRPNFRLWKHLALIEL